MKSKRKPRDAQERADDGKLLPGHVGLPGAGRPPKPVEERYLRVSYRNCSFKEWGKIVRRAVRDAVRGDAPARTWLSKHLGLENLKLHLVMDDNAAKPPLELSRLSTDDLTALLAILKRAQDEEMEAEHRKLH